MCLKQQPTSFGCRFTVDLDEGHDFIQHFMVYLRPGCLYKVNSWNWKFDSLLTGNLKCILGVQLRT